MSNRELLDGKVALVTGAARGIGLAVAEALVDHGAKVVLGDILKDDVEQSAARLGRNVCAAVLDVTDETSTEAAFDETLNAFGRIDIVIPNAGILLLSPGVDTAASDFRRVLDVNLTGAFITATAGARRMVAQGEGGRIIMTSSLFGLRGGRENSAYSASKFGIVGVAECLAAELAEHQILVNCVCPGQMDTDMIRQLFRDRAKLTGQTEAQVRQALESRIPAGHLGPLDHLAGTYIYLASDLCRYVTGQAITVDGGWQIG